MTSNMVPKLTHFAQYLLCGQILLREQETKAAIEDAETQGMEIENQRELLEQEMAKQIEEDRTRLRSVHWAHDRQAAVEKSLLEGALAEQQQEVRLFTESVMFGITDIF